MQFPCPPAKDSDFHKPRILNLHFSCQGLQSEHGETLVSREPPGRLNDWQENLNLIYEQSSCKNGKPTSFLFIIGMNL